MQVSVEYLVNGKGVIILYIYFPRWAQCSIVNMLDIDRLKAGAFFLAKTNKKTSSKRLQGALEDQYDFSV